MQNKLFLPLLWLLFFPPLLISAPCGPLCRDSLPEELVLVLTKAPDYRIRDFRVFRAGQKIKYQLKGQAEVQKAKIVEIRPDTLVLSHRKGEIRRHGVEEFSRLKKPFGANWLQYLIGGSGLALSIFLLVGAYQLSSPDGSSSLRTLVADVFLSILAFFIALLGVCILLPSLLLLISGIFMSHHHRWAHRKNGWRYELIPRSLLKIVKKSRKEAAK